MIARSEFGASPPGDTIADILEERGWSPEDLADKMGMTVAYIRLLLKGAAPITEGVAILLVQALGSTKEFWLKREEQYRAKLQGS